MSNSDNKNTFHVIGLMSGTSLDGLDLTYCQFTGAGEEIAYHIIYAETIDYDQSMKNTFVELENASAIHFLETDRMIGRYFGQAVNKFINKFKIKEVDFVASHGHTIFHQPAKGFTVQVGNGASMAAKCNLPVVCDFRSLDVSLGGQGAPLVPIGDKLLFPDFNFCLNLGGIANITTVNGSSVTAFDICPANMVLNYLANQKGFEFDRDGMLASAGSLHSGMLEALGGLAYYQHTSPKSLGKEWIVAEFIPVIQQYDIPIEDKLATVACHIASQVTNVILKTSIPDARLLVTGGGAFNTYLVEKMRANLTGIAELIIPDEKTVKFKEALIFALLGLLRWKGQVNCLKSVTGASKDNIGGCIYLN